MTPFLYNVAKAYYNNYGNEICNFTFVFPNKRAGLFFQKYLSQIADKPIFSPEIMSVSDLFLSLSNYRLADRIELLFSLYSIYKRISHSEESFDDFLFWGEMILNDFDDIDKYLTDAQQLFRNVQDLKEIDAGFSYLTEDQILAIRRFWANFLPIGDSEKKKDFLEMWQVLHQLYTELRQILHNKGLAYEGMIFRTVAERANKKEDLELPSDKIVFIGLNAHSKSEETLLKYLQELGVADFYWDYSSELVKDPNNKSSFFIDKNKLLFPSQLRLDAEDIPMEKPVVDAIGIPSNIGQAKFVNTILESLISDNEINTKEDILNTAVILPDENLLLPTLYSIPESIDKINVTMGYNLHHSSVAGFMENIFELQKNIRTYNGQTGFYYRYVLPILNYHHLSSVLGEVSDKMRKDILKYNKIIVTQDELTIHPLLAKIFKPVTDWREIPDYLRTILSQINIALVTKKKTLEDESSVSALDMECEFIIEYYKTINKMDEALSNVPTAELKIETYLKLLKKLIQNISVPFSGEPLSGLQIMGILETRALDFENLVILSMNEGIFPQKKVANSFIPHNIRHGFGLPTYENQDSIYAYHFYRMINRAKRIFLLYDTRTEGIQTGEVSRYFYQLKHLYADRFDIRERLAVYEVSTNESLSIEMQKTSDIMQKLQNFLQGGEKSLSASSINMYLDCPLQFYFSVVEGLSEVDEVAETIEASTFGSIFHSVMEWIYAPFIGKLVTADLLQQIKKDTKFLTAIIEKSFAENYFKTPDKIKALTGQNYLTGEVLRRYIKQVLDTDIKLTPFYYIESEKPIRTEYTLPSNQVVSLKGFLDRIDEVDGYTRIIDYKTGKGILRYKNIDQIFDKSEKDRPKAVMQVFMYAHLYLYEHPTKIVRPGIYYLRNLFSDNFSPDVQCKPSRNETMLITDFSELREEFKEKFDECVEEIFNPEIPFTQTPTGKACEWCAFTNICKK